jgi:hypothetical protein
MKVSTQLINEARERLAICTPAQIAQLASVGQRTQEGLARAWAREQEREADADCMAYSRTVARDHE